MYLVLDKAKRRKYVLKAIPLSDPKELDSAQKEARMLQLFNNPFIVKYRANFVDQKHFCIVMEYCDDGDLNGYFQLCKNKRITIPETVCSESCLFTSVYISLPITIFSANYRLVYSDHTRLGLCS